MGKTGQGERSKATRNHACQGWCLNLSLLGYSCLLSRTALEVGTQPPLAPSPHNLTLCIWGMGHLLVLCLPGCQVLVFSVTWLQGPGGKQLIMQGSFKFLSFSFGDLQAILCRCHSPCGCAAPSEASEALGKDSSEAWSKTDFPLSSPSDRSRSCLATSFAGLSAK